MLRKVFIFWLALVVLGISFALAAGLTYANNPPNVAFGSKNISGYAISNFVFTHAENDTDYSQIVTISFSISGSPNTVQIQTVPGGAWKSCSRAVGTVTCDYSSAPLQAQSLVVLNIFASN